MIVIRLLHFNQKSNTYSSAMMKLLLLVILAVSLMFSPTNGLATNMCTLHPPPKYWDVYEEMKLGTSYDLKYYATMLFAPIPFEDLPKSKYKHDEILNKINTDKAGLPCIRQKFLNAYCTIVYLKKPEIKPWIGQIPAMYYLADYLRNKEELEMQVDVAIPKMVYKRYAAIGALPAIADDFYTKALLC